MVKCSSDAESESATPVEEPGFGTSGVIGGESFE